MRVSDSDGVGMAALNTCHASEAMEFLQRYDKNDEETVLGVEIAAETPEECYTLLVMMMPMKQN